MKRTSENAIDLITRARGLCEDMQAATNHGEWEKLAPAERECRALIDRSLTYYDDLAQEEQLIYRRIAAEVLQHHRDILERSKLYLGQLRNDVSKTLKSQKAKKEYTSE